MHYQYLGGLLFATLPGVHELVARCSSLESAQRLAEQDARRRTAAQPAADSKEEA